MSGASRSPLCTLRLSQGAPLGGKIKLRPEDFLVDELPLYDPVGSGEHLYLGIEKQGVPHSELMRCLRRHFAVREMDIGFAGMKDAVAVTRQCVSIHLPGRADPAVELPDPRIKVLWARRHNNKLRRGHLAGNRFAIRIRDIAATKALEVNRRMIEMERTGAPNAFGPQRFGNRLTNHLLGAAVLKEDWDGFVAVMLGETREGQGGEPTNPGVRDAERSDQRVREAGRAGPERSLLIELQKGKSTKAAVLGLGGAALGFFLSSLQSAIFNAVLEDRLRRGSLGKLLLGDLAFKRDSGAVFAVGEADLLLPELESRLARGEICPSGPLLGRKMTAPVGIPLEIEQAAAAQFDMDPSLFTDNPHSPTGARRPLTIPVGNPSVEGGADLHGEYVRVAFDLPAGSFATTIIRELLGDSSDSDED